MNLFFFKVDWLCWSKDTRSRFSFMRERDDYCLTFGRHEIWVIPRYSTSFFQ